MSSRAAARSTQYIEKTWCLPQTTDDVCVLCQITVQVGSRQPKLKYTQIGAHEVYIYSVTNVIDLM